MVLKQHKKVTGPLALVLVLTAVVIEVICQVNMDDNTLMGKKTGSNLVLNKPSDQDPNNAKLDHRLRSVQNVCLLVAITLMVNACCA